VRSDHSAFASVERRSSAHALAASMPDALWRADALGSHATAGVCSGFPELDRELPGGGWPPAALTELLLTQHGGGEFRLLAPVLHALSQAGRSIILLAPPHRLCAPALAQLDFDLRHVLLIQPEKPADRMWAAEQILKSAHFGILLCWLPQARPEQLRRLQVAASGGEGLCFVFRPAAAQRESSPAPLRLLCQPMAAGYLSVEIIKRRGPAAAAPLILRPPLPAVLNDALAHGRPDGRVPVREARSHPSGRVPASGAPAMTDAPAGLAVRQPAIAAASLPDDFSPPSFADAAYAMDRPHAAGTAAGSRLPPLA
jgi:cell division inhibitor SulA